VVGWVLPSAINLLILGFLVVPGFEPLDWRKQGPLLLASAVVLGVILASLQTPLYRLLEGYVGWQPGRGGPLNWSRERQLRQWRELNERVDLLEMSLAAKSQKGLREALRERFESLKAGETARRYGERDLARTGIQRGLLRERRGPVSGERGSGGAHAAGQRHPAGGGVWLVAAAAVAVGQHWLGAAVLVGLDFWWYHRAVKATDDWAGASRALVNLARKPLAASLGLELPSSLDSERAMWGSVSRMAQHRHDDRSADLDTYRDSG